MAAATESNVVDETEESPEFPPPICVPDTDERKLTPEEEEIAVQKAQILKAEGNALFSSHEYAAAAGYLPADDAPFALCF